MRGRRAACRGCAGGLHRTAADAAAAPVQQAFLRCIWRRARSCRRLVVLSTRCSRRSRCWCQWRVGRWRRRDRELQAAAGAVQAKRAAQAGDQPAKPGLRHGWLRRRRGWGVLPAAAAVVCRPRSGTAAVAALPVASETSADSRGEAQRPRRRRAKRLERLSANRGLWWRQRPLDMHKRAPCECLKAPERHQAVIEARRAERAAAVADGQDSQT